MNPLLERRYYLSRYVALFMLFAAAYATVFGALARIEAAYAVLDGFVTWLVLGFEGLMLWNILKYGTEGTSKPVLKAVYYAAVGILFTGTAIGIESLVMSGVLTEEEFGSFVQTIPARSLCLVLVYVLFALYYAYAGRSDENREEIVSVIRESASSGPETEPIERITVRGGQKIKVIGVGEIIYLQAEGDYVAIVTADGRWLKEQTMKYFEENLPRAGFVRVHRSYIVSVSNISRIEQAGRDNRVILRDGTAIRISPTGYKLLKHSLGL